MEILIQNVESDLFMNAASGWGPREEAYNFRTATFAIDLCMMRRLRGIRIIVDTGDPESAMVLEVQEDQQTASRGAMRKNGELRGRRRRLKAGMS